MSLESEKQENSEVQKAGTIVTGRDAEVTTHSYRPARWQSNITIISCVSLMPKDME